MGPELLEHPGGHPLAEVVVHRTRWAELLARQRLPLHPGAQHVEDGFGHPLEIHGSWSALLALARRDQRLHRLPHIVRQYPRWSISSHPGPPASRTSPLRRTIASVVRQAL